jgi:hypothetical protein
MVAYGLWLTRCAALSLTTLLLIEGARLFWPVV